MSVENHVKALKEKHANLDSEISKAQASPGTDSLDITAMKREKLALKEEIERLSAA